MISGPLAEVSVRGLVFAQGSDENGRTRTLHLALVQTDGQGPALHIRSAAIGETDAYEVSVAALRTALTALPLKDLLRVVREARP